MDDYIKREALRDALYDADAITMNGVKILNQFPSTDVAPVRHGRWIPALHVGDCCYHCSECQFLRDAYLIDIGNYCPNCGAKMDRECDA